MLAENATLQSINLTNSLENFGISTLKDELTSDGLTCKVFGTSTKSVLNWIKEGSVCEDDTFTQAFARYKHHFYDPQHNGKGFGGMFWPNSGFMSGKPAPIGCLIWTPPMGSCIPSAKGGSITTMR
jgi:hypothetical protein